MSSFPINPFPWTSLTKTDLDDATKILIRKIPSKSWQLLSNSTFHSVPAFLGDWPPRLRLSQLAGIRNLLPDLLKDTTNALENVYNFAKYFPLFPTICRSNTIFNSWSPQLVTKVSSTTRGIMLLHQLVCDWTYCRTQLGFSSTGLSSTNCLPPIILHQ